MYTVAGALLSGARVHRIRNALCVCVCGKENSVDVYICVASLYVCVFTPSNNNIYEMSV